MIRGTLDYCLEDLADRFDIPFSSIWQYAQVAPYADRLPNRAYPKATGTPSERRILYALARYSQPITAVECGVNWGVSTIQIASALKDNGHGHLTAIDIRATIEGNRPVGALIPSTLRKHITMQGGKDASVVIPAISSIDYLFEDASHTYEDTFAIYIAALPNLRAGAWMISHDAVNRPAVLRAIQDCGLEPIVYVPDGTRNGVAICRNL